MADGSVKVKVDLDKEKFEASLRHLEGTIGGWAKGAGLAFAAVGAAMAATVLKLGADVIRVGAEYTASLSGIKAVSGASAEEMEELGAAAKKAGEDTVFSANESAKAIEELIKAGLTTEQVLGGGLTGALNLAAAGEISVAAAAEIASTALNAFRDDQLSVSQAADILAGAANASATDVMGLKLGLSQVSAVASSVGLSFKDTTTALSVFAQNGLKGSDAGTSLKTMLMNLQPVTTRQENLFKKLGLTTEDNKNKFYDLNGEIRPLNEIAGTLRTSMQHLTDQERQMALETMFGSDAIRAANILYKEGAIGIEKMATAIEKIKAAEVAAERLNNLKGDVEFLSGSIETLGISIYESFDKPLREATQSVTDGVGIMARAFEAPEMQAALDTLGEAFADLVTDAAEIATKAIPAIVKGFAFLVEHGQSVIAMLAALGVGFGVFKLLPVIQGAIDAFKLAKVSIISYNAALAAANVSNVVFTGTLTAQQIVVGFLTGQIGLAVAVTKLWTLALAATPMGAFGLAIMAAGAALAFFALNMEDSNAAAKEAAKETQKFIEQSDALLESIDKSNKAHLEKVQGLENESAATGLLAQKVLELSDSDLSLAENEAALLGYIEQLNTAVPELNLYYDEQTKSLSLSEEQIHKLIDAKKEMLLMQAEEERGAEIAKQIVQVQAAAADAAQRRADAEANLAAVQTGGIAVNDQALEQIAFMTGSYESAGAGADMYSGTVAGLKDQEAELSAQEAELQVQLDASMQKVGEYQKQRIEGAAQIANAAQGMNSSLGLVYRDEKERNKALEEAYKAVAEVAMNAFDKIKQGTASSLTDMTSILKSNQEVVKQWGTNLDILAKIGIDQGFLETLRKMGPEGAKQSQVLVDELAKTKNGIAQSFDQMDTKAQEKLTAFNETMEKGTQLATDTVNRQFGEPEFTDAASKGVSTMASTLNANHSVQDAVGNMVKTAKDKGDAAITAANFSSMGRSISQGIAEGVRSGGGAVGIAVGAAIGAANEAGRRRAGIRSPSRLFRDDIGVWLPAGIADGVRAGTPGLRNTIADQFGSLAATARSALAGVGGALGGLGLSGAIGLPPSMMQRGGATADFIPASAFSASTIESGHAAPRYEEPSSYDTPNGFDYTTVIGDIRDSVDSIRDMIKDNFNGMFPTGNVSTLEKSTQAATNMSHGAMPTVTIEMQNVNISSDVDVDMAGLRLGKQIINAIRDQGVRQ